MMIMRPDTAASRIRWGLCCQFLDAPIRFRTATYRYVATLSPRDGRAYLAGIVRDNAHALGEAITHCVALGIGAFRINSAILPLSTHPKSSYTLPDLDGDGSITAAFVAAGVLAVQHDVRLSFHPDQFVVLNSERADVVESSLEEMRAQGDVAQLVGADVLTLHPGSFAGGSAAAFDRLERGIERLSDAARQRLALENDDRRFSPELLLPFCDRLGVPMVYDAHHHRCTPDALDLSEASARAAATWHDREPHFHVSSPRDGWDAPDPRPHADYVVSDDLPDAWLDMKITVDVEAKAKERAVLALRESIARDG